MACYVTKEMGIHSFLSVITKSKKGSIDRNTFIVSLGKEKNPYRKGDGRKQEKKKNKKTKIPIYYLMPTLIDLVN